jgi:serine/threonine protein kinase
MTENRVRLLNILLGEGRHSKVWAALMPSGDAAAVKISDQEITTVESAEQQDWRHPNIARMFYTLKRESKHQFVMERYNTDLRRWLEERPILSHREIHSIMSQLRSAISFIRRRGVVHRNITPSNIFVDHGDPIVVRLGDFGMALHDDQLGVADVPDELLHSRYSSPQLMTRSPYTAKTDLWSVGVILYELATRRPLLTGDLCEALETFVLRPMVDYDLGRHGNDLLKSLLERDESSRISVEDFLEHPYFSQPSPVMLYDIGSGTRYEFTNKTIPSRFNTLRYTEDMFYFVDREKRRRGPISPYHEHIGVELFKKSLHLKDKDEVIEYHRRCDSR